VIREAINRSLVCDGEKVECFFPGPQFYPFRSGYPGEKKTKTEAQCLVVMTVMSTDLCLKMFGQGGCGRDYADAIVQPHLNYVLDIARYKSRRRLPGCCLCTVEPGPSCADAVHIMGMNSPGHAAWSIRILDCFNNPVCERGGFYSDMEMFQLDK
jgi:hypothetical protein